jgi:hypothetical protein
MSYENEVGLLPLPTAISAIVAGWRIDRAALSSELKKLKTYC